MILANDFHRQWEEIRADATAAFEKVGGSGWYILGRQVEAFEEALAALWKLPHCVGVASGLDAIQISLETLGCQPGSKVLTTPLSAFATTLAIVRLGAIPVFVDVDEFGLLDMHAAQCAIERDPSIRFFVPVHLYGHALDVEKLDVIGTEFNIAIVEDCAQSIRASSKGKPTGSAGQMAAVSFYPTKNLGALGDAGALLTSDAGFAEHARALRDYGQSAKYQHRFVGHNSRLDELQACLLLNAGLPRLERWTARRREIAHRYVTGIQNPDVRVPGAPPGSESSWHLFPALVRPERKSQFLTHLAACGIKAAEHYPVAIPDQPALAEAPHEIGAGGVERARLFATSEVSLPIHPYLTDAEIATVIESVNYWRP